MKRSNAVQIGDQIWMAKNLNVRKFRNGDPIPVISNDEEWAVACEKHLPACCFFENMWWIWRNYGKLYNWYAVNDPRGLAPEGCHVPADNEWEQLIDFLGGKEVAGTKLKGRKEWNWDGYGTNESRFNAYPGCYREANGEFYGILEDGWWWKDDGYWWTSTEQDGDSAWLRDLSCNEEAVYRYAFDKGCGISVRCLKD
jgi:uncharacterized protein (TIGR02145 family)